MRFLKDTRCSDDASEKLLWKGFRFSQRQRAFLSPWRVPHTRDRLTVVLGTSSSWRNEAHAILPTTSLSMFPTEFWRIPTSWRSEDTSRNPARYILRWPFRPNTHPAQADSPAPLAAGHGAATQQMPDARATGPHNEIDILPKS